MAELYTPDTDRTKPTNSQYDTTRDPVPYAGYPYDQITAKGISTLAKKAIRRIDEQINAVVSSDELTWSTIAGALNEMNDEESQSIGRALFMEEVHPDEAVRNAATDAQTKLSHHSNDIWYRVDLYEKVKTYSETDEAKALEGEEARSLADAMREFKMLGHDLDPTARARMQELNKALTDNGIQFDKNLRDDKSEVLLTIDELDGVPQDVIDDLKQNKSGMYRLTMKYPHYVPFIERANNRDARRKVSVTYNTRAVEANRPILEDTIAKRQEIAEILGYPSWAHRRLVDRMAKTPEAVKAFYAELVQPLATKADAELAVLTEMLHADGFEGPLKKYDKSYYETKLRERDYGVNQEEVAEYFPMESTLSGLFSITGETFGLKYRKLDTPTWHEDVMAYAIDDAATGEQISTFYMDLYPREGKFNHAAAFPLQQGRELPDGTYRKPESAIVANFTKPTANKPSLLKHEEVSTLFHEFGHILHQTLTRARLSEFAGTAVERDFVEAPSQIMEHWVEKPEILQRFARHYRTGEPFPEDLLKGIVASQKLNVALFTLRQMSLGYLDMAIHDDSPIKDLDKILSDSSALSLLSDEEGTFFPASFGHLFGYDAGYYGYLWSEVYGDDMFSVFEQQGLTNPEVGMRYRRTILERGGTIDAIDMITEFLEREPNNVAFLKNKDIAVA